MLKKKAKLISMLMTLSLLSVAMVGCGGKDEPAPTVSEETIPEDDGRGDVIDDANPLEAVVEDVDDELEAQPLGATGYDTNGEIAFTIYNNSAYDIYSAYVGSTTSSVDTDIDILTSILPANESFDFQATLEESAWEITDWTIYFTDTDGDTSQSYDTFNAWDLAYIDITWDSDNGGYVCDFVYNDEIDDNPLAKGNAVVTTDEIVAWNMYFSVYNETPYEIYAISMGTAEGSIDDDVDILKEKTLPAGAKLDVEATLDPEWRNITEWTLYITDTDGDTSQIYDVFDPWEVSYVDIKWDTNNGGYYCEFVY